MQRVAQRFWWPSMQQDIVHWIRSCEPCARKNDPPRHARAPLMPIPPAKIFDRLVIDVLGPLPTSETGHRFIVIFTDSLTKYVEAFATHNHTAATIADF